MLMTRSSLSPPSNVARPRKEEWRTPGAFQVFASRKCLDCGQVWESAASRGWLLVGIVIGLFFLGVGVSLIWARRGFGGMTAVVLGVGALLGCIERWWAKGPLRETGMLRFAVPAEAAPGGHAPRLLISTVAGTPQTPELRLPVVGREE